MLQNHSIICRPIGGSNIRFNNLTVVEGRLILVVAEILQTGWQVTSTRIVQCGPRLNQVSLERLAKGVSTAAKGFGHAQLSVQRRPVDFAVLVAGEEVTGVFDGGTKPLPIAV